MMDTAKKELSQILLLLAVILGGVVVFQWLLVNDLCSPSSYVLLRLEKILRKAMMIRFIYVLVITGLAFLYPSRNIKKDESLKGAYTALTLLLATVLVQSYYFSDSIYIVHSGSSQNGWVLYEVACLI